MEYVDHKIEWSGWKDSRSKVGGEQEWRAFMAGQT